MSKLLSTSVLALGVMCAVPAVAETIQGGHLYIQDRDAPVQITYEASKATHTTILYIGMLDMNGNYVNSSEPFVALLRSTGTPSDMAYLGTCYTCLMTGNTYTFTPSEDAVQLVFFWSNETVGGSFWSTVVENGRNPVDSTGNRWDSITYYSGNRATVGFEDGGGGRSGGRVTDWDWNDVVISLTNVASTVPPVKPPVLPLVPEPETWAMMLAGLGMVSAVVRRRRNKI
ncbi:MAG: PEPxxWA-CTERM sorting domain-containing protein [Azoarcus sp.]|jgi:hypothetical protein|nr:PEPxxWA-CTERM sorting domain-containing protein [Azoarcus sp.]